MSVPDQKPSTDWVSARRAVAVVRLLFELPRGARVLLLGCIDARLVETLLEAGHQLLVRAEPGRLGWLDPLETGAHFRCEEGALLPLPHADRSFEAALAFGVVSTPERLKGTVSELCRVARRTVLIDFPSRPSLQALLARDPEFVPLSEAQVRDAFERQGFRACARTRQRLLPATAHRGRGMLAPGIEAISRALGITGVLGSPALVRAVRVLAQERVSEPLPATKVTLPELRGSGVIPEA